MLQWQSTLYSLGNMHTNIIKGGSKESPFFVEYSEIIKGCSFEHPFIIVAL